MSPNGKNVEEASVSEQSTASTSSSSVLSRPRRYEVAAGHAEQMPPTLSLALILYSTLLCGINLVIVIPTAEEYATRLGGDQFFSGLMIGALPLWAAIGIFLNQRLMRCLSFKSVLLVLATGTVFGNVLYALAGLMHFKWTILAARCLIGLCNGFNLPSMYIALTVGMRRRSEVILYFSAMNTLGYAFGPALAAVLDLFVKSIQIHNLVLDADTVPGWFMAMAYLLFMAKIVIFFEDLPMEATSPKPLVDKTCERLPMRGCCAAFWYMCMAATLITCIEVYAVNVGQHYWGWSIVKSAMFLAGLMLCSGLSNLAMGRLTQRFIRSDRAGLLGSSLCGCASCALLFNFDLHPVVAQASVLGTGLMLALIVLGLIRAFGLAVSSKLVPTQSKGLMNTWATIFMTIGRGAGGIIGAALQPNSFFPVVLSLFAVTLLLSIASYPYMKPNEKAN